MFGLGMILVGFIWSFLSNVGVKEKVNFDNHKPLPELIKKSVYEKDNDHVIRVEVLNGCGVRKLASLYREYLRANGIDVIRAINANHSEYEKTKIIRRQGELAICEELSRIIGLDGDKIETEVSPGMVVDATIILGQDYDDLSSFQDALQYKEP